MCKANNGLKSKLIAELDTIGGMNMTTSPRGVWHLRKIDKYIDDNDYAFYVDAKKYLLKSWKSAYNGNRWQSCNSFRVF